jgi:hypothetical protein
MHDVVPVKHRQEAIDRSDSITGTGRNVLSQDAPGVLNGTNKRILVGIIHDAQFPQSKYKFGMAGFVPTSQGAQACTGPRGCVKTVCGATWAMRPAMVGRMRSIHGLAPMSARNSSHSKRFKIQRLDRG